jgi:hypothetical protein
MMVISDQHHHSKVGTVCGQESFSLAKEDTLLMGSLNRLCPTVLCVAHAGVVIAGANPSIAVHEANPVAVNVHVNLQKQICSCVTCASYCGLLHNTITRLSATYTCGDSSRCAIRCSARLPSAQLSSCQKRQGRQNQASHAQNQAQGETKT